jgi:hypothetical protein
MKAKIIHSLFSLDDSMIWRRLVSRNTAILIKLKHNNTMIF